MMEGCRNATQDCPDYRPGPKFEVSALDRGIGFLRSYPAASADPSCPVRSLDIRPRALDAGGMETPGERSWRRFARFSVRGLIVLVLVVGFVLGWFVRRAHLQSEAVAAVRNAGGTVAYDWEDKEWHPVQGGKPGGPKWLADRLGPDYFDTVIAVLDGHTMSDAEMPLIGELDRLEVLDINDASAVSDLGLSPVTALKRLRKLSIRGTRATDAGLEHIKNLTKLEELDLDNTEVSGAGLKFLEKLTRLLILSLSGTDVDDAGLEHLKGLTNLEALRLGQTKITGAGTGACRGAHESAEPEPDGDAGR